MTKVGPRKTIDKIHLQLHSQRDRDMWMAKAKLQAVVGGCAGSLPSVESGIRCFYAFAENVLGRRVGVLPPSLDEILAYSTTFRCDETFTNYLGYLKVGCMMAGKPTEVFSDNAIKRSKRAIRRRRGFTKRKKMFLQGDVVRLLMVFTVLNLG